MNSIEIFIVCITVIHLILAIFAFKDLFTIAQLMLVGKIIWTLVIAFFLISGPLIYLHYGRGERSWNVKVRELQQRALEMHSQNNDSQEN